MPDHAGTNLKSFNERKREILSAIQDQLLKLNIMVREGEIHSAVTGGTWSIWIEQKNGLDSSKDKFLVNLDELAEGIDYVMAAGYRARRWSHLLGDRLQKTPLGVASGKSGLAPILMAEDDEDDRIVIRKFLDEAKVENPFRTVSDGEQLLDYLFRRGKFSGSGEAQLPCLILLDLNMPRMDGREALKIIKRDERLRKIPVLILTTSRAPEDIQSGYEDGANSYITKPKSIDGLMKLARSIRDYWLNAVRLPTDGVLQSPA